VKCSNSSNHRRLESVPVPRIRDVSLLCYQFQSEKITETAKRSNAVNYLDSTLSHPGLLKPNRDILASRRQRSGFRDRVSETETVPEKSGRLVSLTLKLHLAWPLRTCISVFAYTNGWNTVMTPAVITAWAARSIHKITVFWKQNYTILQYSPLKK